MFKVAEEKLQELRDYLLVCMPFGTPLEMDIATVRGILAAKDSVTVPKQKVRLMLLSLSYSTGMAYWFGRSTLVIRVEGSIYGPDLLQKV